MRAMALKHIQNVLSFPRRAKPMRHAPWQAAFAALDARIAEIERRVTGLDHRFAAISARARFRYALVLSLLTHALIIYGIAFKVSDKPRLDEQNRNLEVVLVNARSQTPPLAPDALAQHNLDGGGNVESKRRARSPLPVMPDQKVEAEVKLALRRVEQLEYDARQFMTSAKSKVPVEAVQPAPKPAQAEAEPKAKPEAIDIRQRSLEIARLEAQISRDWDAYQQRPRRRYVGARTQEYRFARYIEDWRQKVERIGDLNYPQAARDQRLYGSLVVTVAIKADGTVEQVDVNRPSGHKVLDDAARRIVQLAGPFAAFPADIAKDTDVLHITRTWTFTAADRFQSQ